jgi:signal transduction histidine kinase/DNA-binding response OmpR family regulator
MSLKLLTYRLSKLLSVCILHLIISGIPSAFAQQQFLNLSVDTLDKHPKGLYLKQAIWFFRSGDNMNWKDIMPSSQYWKPVKSNFGNTRPLANWNGIGWFKLLIKADKTLQNQMLAFRLNHDGASELYLDGKRIGGYGKLGNSKSTMIAARAPHEIIPFQINDNNIHVLSIRYSNFNAYFQNFIGFEVWTGTYDQMALLTRTNSQRNDLPLISAGAQLGLAILHIFLFLFYPKQRLNLYYSICVLLSASTIVLRFVIYDTTEPSTQALANNAFAVSIILCTLSIGLLFYAVSYAKLPKWRTIIITSMAVGLLAYMVIMNLQCDCMIVTHKLSLAINTYFLLVNLDGIWAIIKAIRAGKPGVWLIGLGMFILALFFFFVGANVFGYFNDDGLTNQWMSFGLLVLPLCFSIYLAVDFSRTNRDLSIKLVQVQELSELNRAQETEKLKLITEQAQQLELTVLQRTAQVQSQADKLREMDSVKSRFMINLTHEFRTPLTLILGPVKQILSNIEDEFTIARANVIYRNADRLLQLTNQMLDLSKIEAGKMEVNQQATDIVALVKRDFLSFQSLADEKGIKLLFSSDWTTLWLATDQDKIEKIVLNLLSNAFKFTPQDGSIKVALTESNSDNGAMLNLLVSDTGSGIPTAKMPYIFDRFYQVDSSDTRAHEGTGIGLAITKELTELLGGSITFNSVEGEGTKVNVSIPILLSEETEALTTPQNFSSPFTSVTTNLQDPQEAQILPLDSPLILVIEDNAELRKFIVDILRHDYRVLEAVNGQDGLETGLEAIPDLVITDLMMPVMDGYQVCEALKNNERTSHIPVVILSAKTGVDNRISGLAIQADAYLDKPFDERELLATLNNLITLRKQLQKRYSVFNARLANTAAVPSMEKTFLDKVLRSVETHLDDEQFSVDMLANDMNMSRTQLHRKLTALIDQSPGDLIRITRLQRAFDLLKNKAGNVAEVSYMVGYGNPKNFSTSFSKHFGFPPTEVPKS